jgi:tRNA (cytidine/uridine-2'-O-)-methyltransferase
VTTNPLFHVVLHEPEIPNNTGNIGRTCIATGCALHLVRPLGFSTSEKACRRAGLDYWPRLNPVEHDSLDDFLGGGWGGSDRREEFVSSPLESRVWVFTTKSSRPAWEAEFSRGDVLLFGKETSGLPSSILERYPDRLRTLPMRVEERSLNLATAVCAVVYEGLRQLTVRKKISLDAAGRILV